MRSFFSKRSSVLRTAIGVGVITLGILASVSDAKPPRPFPAKNPKPILLSEHGKIVSSPFQGPKANTGTVANTHENGKCVLTLSDEFEVPETPAPHWQIVDSRGNTFLLNRLKIDGGKYNRSITVPSYINDVAKVQIWCAFAEVNLGEAAFAVPVPNK